jgi:hypothetical protein
MNCKTCNDTKKVVQIPRELGGDLLPSNSPFASPNFSVYPCPNCTKEGDKLFRPLNTRWRDANPEKLRELKKKQYDANPEKFREAQKKWNKANPEKYREYQKKYRDAHRQDLREYQKKYYLNRKKLNE